MSSQGETAESETNEGSAQGSPSRSSNKNPLWRGRVEGVGCIWAQPSMKCATVVMRNRKQTYFWLWLICESFVRKGTSKYRKGLFLLDFPFSSPFVLRSMFCCLHLIFGDV